MTVFGPKVRVPFVGMIELGFEVVGVRVHLGDQGAVHEELTEQREPARFSFPVNGQKRLTPRGIRQQELEAEAASVAALSGPPCSFDERAGPWTRS